MRTAFEAKRAAECFFTLTKAYLAKCLLRLINLHYLPSYTYTGTDTCWITLDQESGMFTKSNFSIVRLFVSGCQGLRSCQLTSEDGWLSFSTCLPGQTVISLLGPQQNVLILKHCFLVIPLFFPDNILLLSFCRFLSTSYLDIPLNYSLHPSAQS